MALHGLSHLLRVCTEYMFNLIPIDIMAIINSLAIGKSVKSAGNLTYKTVRGRTIASQRISSNKSNTANQQNQRQRFANVSTSMRLLQQYIDTCYENSKYGSSRNAFFSTNKRFTLGNMVGEVAEGIVTLSDAMLSALTEEPVKQLSLLSLGSLAGFLTIRYKDVEDYTYGEITYGSLRVITGSDGTSYQSGEYDFQFSSPVKRDSLKIHFFGFSDNGLIVSTGRIDVPEQGHIAFNDSSVTAAMASTRAWLMGDNYEFVESVHVEVDSTKLTNCPIAIVVPSVGGRVPTIAGVFAKESAV